MIHKKNIINCLTAIVLICSCNKNKLDQPALGLLDESKLANKKGVESLLIGAYALLDGVSKDDQGAVGSWASAASNWIYGSICGSEAYKGSDINDQSDITPIESFKSFAASYYFNDKWAAVYAGVQRANSVLRVMKKATDIKPEDWQRLAAEAKFLRAHYHFEAIKLWNKVPFVDENITYDGDNYHLSNDTLIWPAIENDLKFAMANLPFTQLNAIGRANKYAAEALLVKAYMFQQKYRDAQPLLQDIITNGVNSGARKYALVNYADNFNPATQNSEETIFSTQSSVRDGSVTDYYPGNGNAGDLLNFPVGGPGGCCGFFQPSQFLVNHFRTDTATGLPDLDNFNEVPVKNDMGLLSSLPFTPDSGTLDSRLDWTVGRRGIPFLDWGDHPGHDWIRDQDFGGPYSPIKNVYYKAQEGSLTDLSFWTKGITANNVNLIRYADVLLWAAEVEIEIGDLNKARDYINVVRRRAADSSGWVKKADGSPAANYKVGEYNSPWTDKAFARKAVRYERMLELAMEGHRFFDLVRWEIADIEINAYLQKEKNLRSYLSGAQFTKNKNEYFPIPQAQIDLSAGADGVAK
ncbi:MAG: Starch-binding associating with outer rane, partial [Chitinophagaceae bacterium]|nr:Starch-binding associating with outer rane [Chitinophagaceae bacterium]